MAGLLAAKALAGHFEQVTLVERDIFPTLGEGRKGVPQGRHAHGLLAEGLRIMEGFFPGLTQDLVQKGALSRDIIGDALWYQNRGFHLTFESGFRGLLVSRPLLEGYIRQRLLALPNVHSLQGASVRGLLVREGQVKGVVLKSQQLSELTADLVVDASGRGSQAGRWLVEHGYQPAREEMVRINLAYATRVYRRRPQDFAGKDAFVIGSNAPDTRGGVALAIEGDRWIITMAGYLGDYPPVDEAGFLEFARTLPVPDVYQVIKDAEPLSDIVGYRFPGSVRRHYQELNQFPEGFVVIGDAICSFNPIFGQGMTVATTEAQALQQALEQGLVGLAQRFFRRAGVLIDGPWSIAVGADLRYPQVEGPRSAMTNFVNWYIAKLHIAARRDPQLVLAFQKVANLISPPPSLLTPSLALRVLWGNLTAGFGNATSNLVRRHPNVNLR